MGEEKILFEDLEEELLEIYNSKKKANKAIENKIREVILKDED